MLLSFFKCFWLYRFEYPQPTFQKLMKEQCMEPFFVFQVDSVLSMDFVLLYSFPPFSFPLSQPPALDIFWEAFVVSHMVVTFLPSPQVFCVGLWCLDEYWYYSLFTLFMLFMFESTMAKSRLKTLSELRRVRVDTQTIMVHRSGKYVISTTWDTFPFSWPLWFLTWNCDGGVT